MTSPSPSQRSVTAHMFWAYGDLSRLEVLCARSFVAQGFQLNVWTYGNLGNAPSGTRIRDARDVLPESRVFLNSKGSYAGFSDYFRYAVLNRFGGIYADTDVVAVQAASRLPESPFLVTERIKGQPDAIKVNGNIMWNPAPKPGNIVDLALAYTHRFPKEDITWAEIGPDLLTAIVSMYPKHGFDLMPPEYANPLNWWDCPQALLQPGVSIPDGTAFVHCYNEMWRRSNIDKNSIDFPAGGIMDSLARAYL